MNVSCPTCTRPLAPEPMPNIGGIRFCTDSCIAQWFANGHDRRRMTRPVPWERRQA